MIEQLCYCCCYQEERLFWNSNRTGGVEKANEKLALIMSVTEMCVLQRKELYMTWYLWTIELTFLNRDVQLHIKYSNGLLTEH